MSHPEKIKESYAKPQKQKYMKPQDVITDETVIPSLPTNIIAEPQHQQLVQKCQKLKDEMGSLNNVLKTFIQETIANIKNKKNQTRISVGPLQIDLDEKLKKFKDVQAQFNEIRQILDEKKRVVELQQSKCDQIKLKMKNYNGSGDQLRKEIQDLKDQISDSKITIKQEKDIVQKISSLELILPYAAQCDEQQAVLKGLLEDKKQTQQIYFKSKEEYTDLKTKLNKVRDQINQVQNMTSEEQEQVQPIIDAKRSEIDAKILIIKEKIQELNTKYDEDLETYKSQKALIEKIEWMKKEQKAYLVNKKNEEKTKQLREKRQKEEEELKQRKEAEEKELAQDPYNENVTICNLLIEYCKKLQPKQQKQEFQEQAPKVDVEKVITGKDWKKDNVSLVVSKKSQDLDLVQGKKAKQQKKNQDNQSQKDEHLNHQVEVLNYFEHVRVSPPILTKQLQECITLLEEKKQYFAEQPQETKQENQKKVTNQFKQEKRNQAKQTASFQESSFPTL